MIAAAREALLNAARHAHGPEPIRLFAEVGAGSIEAYVRDRGPGFDPAAVPADRRGVRESILGRMSGRAGAPRSAPPPSGGTEVVLEIARAGAAEGAGPR